MIDKIRVNDTDYAVDSELLELDFVANTSEASRKALCKTVYERAQINLNFSVRIKAEVYTTDTYYKSYLDVTVRPVRGKFKTGADPFPVAGAIILENYPEFITTVGGIHSCPKVRINITNADGTFEYIQGNIVQLMSYNSGQDFSTSRGYAKALATDNDKSFTPTGDYNPATKKYVDDKPKSYTGYNATKTQVLKNINGTLTWVDE